MNVPPPSFTCAPARTAIRVAYKKSMMRVTSMNKFLIVAAMLSLGACTTTSMDGAEKEDAAGLRAFAACDFQTAEATYADLAAEHPLNPYYHLNLGAARHKLGQTDLAVDSYMKAIELGEAAPIATQIESDGCDTAAAASSVDESVSTTVANLGRENLERLLKIN